MTDTEAAVRRIYERWHETLGALDLDGIVGLYAEDTVIETPAVLAMFPEMDEGILHGREGIRKLFGKNFKALAGAFEGLYRSEVYLSQDGLLVWEYPRRTPRGEQVDLVESMDIVDGLIAYHRVYWGWKGFKALQAARDKQMA